MHHRSLPLVLLTTTLLTLMTTTMTTTATAAQTPTTTRPFQTIEDFMALGGRTRVIAHRGFSGVAPENTLVAMERAIAVGADMIEIDVTLSRDGHVILLHDETLDRTTNGQGPALEATLEDLRRLDAGSWFAQEFAGEKIPTLAEALELIRGKILLNIEIKGEAVSEQVEGGIADKVLQLVRRYDVANQIVISSFEPRALLHTRQLDPQIKTASLYNDEVQAGQSPGEVMDAVSSNGFNLSQVEVSQTIVQTCHRLGRPVAVYTVNEKTDMRRLILLEVNAMFTNYPDRLFEVLQEPVPAKE